MQPKDSIYRVNTEESQLETIVFKEKDDELNPVEDYLNSEEVLKVRPHGERVSLKRVQPKKTSTLKLLEENFKVKVASLRNSMPSILYSLKRLLMRVVCVLMVVGMLLITLISAFAGVR
jgi:hypothetical protein